MATALTEVEDLTVDPGLAAAIEEWSLPVTRNQPYVLGILHGEGVGPEVVDVALDLLRILSDHTPLTFELRVGGPIGGAAERECGRWLTDEVVAFCDDTFAAGGAVFCGPGGGRFVYDLRRRFDLYCKLIPLRSWPVLHDTGVLRPQCVAGTDIVVVRENTGGLYFGEWGQEVESGALRAAYQTCRYREDEVARILGVGFRLAHRRSGRLAVITKPGGIPAISRLWADLLHEMNGDSGLETRVLEIDNAAYQMIACPRDFDVVVCSNMFGDVLGDIGGLLLGSRGMSYSGNYAPGGRAVYQTGHGAAWDLAGTDRANPVGQISSLVMMLRETFGLSDAAAAIERAVRATLAQGVRTPDIASPSSRPVGTRELGRAISENLVRVLESQTA
jgi:3-isopropylmalate dehydrogenase